MDLLRQDSLGLPHSLDRASFMKRSILMALAHELKVKGKVEAPIKSPSNDVLMINATQEDLKI